jgi:hypothetical protein
VRFGSGGRGQPAPFLAQQMTAASRRPGPIGTISLSQAIRCTGAYHAVDRDHAAIEDGRRKPHPVGPWESARGDPSHREAVVPTPTEARVMNTEPTLRRPSGYSSASRDPPARLVLAYRLQCRWPAAHVPASFLAHRQAAHREPNQVRSQSASEEAPVSCPFRAAPQQNGCSANSSCAALSQISALSVPNQVGRSW